MAPISKARLLNLLRPYMPAGQEEALIRAAIAEAGLPVRPSYTAAEVAVIGAAVMQRARTLAADAVARAEA